MAEMQAMWWCRLLANEVKDTRHRKKHETLNEEKCEDTWYIYIYYIYTLCISYWILFSKWLEFGQLCCVQEGNPLDSTCYRLTDSRLCYGAKLSAIDLASLPRKPAVRNSFQVTRKSSQSHPLKCRKRFVGFLSHLNDQWSSFALKNLPKTKAWIMDTTCLRWQRRLEPLHVFGIGFAELANYVDLCLWRLGFFLHGRVDRESGSKFKDLRSLTLNGQNWISSSTIRHHVFIWRFTLRSQALNLFLGKPQICGFQMVSFVPKVKLMCPSSVFKDLFAVQLARWDLGARKDLGNVIFLPIFELFSPKTMFFFVLFGLEMVCFFESLLQFSLLKWHEMTSFTRRVGNFCEGHLQHRVVQRLVDTTTGLELSFHCQHHLPIGSTKPFFEAKFAGTCYVRQWDFVLREML